MSKSKMFRHMTVGAILGGVLFSGVSYAATSMNITVNFLPLKYYFDGVEKKAPADQQGFIYKGTTYVPLRFVSDALGKKVGYDGKTTSIYVGKQKEGTVTYLDDMPTLTRDEDNRSLAGADGFITNMNEVYSRSWLVGDYYNSERYRSYEYVLDGNYSEFNALIAPWKDWATRAKTNNVGSLRIYADDVIVYDSGAVSSDITKPIAVEADLTGALKLRVEMHGRGIGLLEARLFIAY